ncbi:diguanylate cyclase [Dechloromonas sp. XY25]|uniref:diguanylate cyclase n=1 Tax=Dechloromonas hankyongensis TaxID=2908002 RepID=A0ABS9K2S7_9RHOO|nr:diguanylate cyclase [Dechloromonas hankyongensis]MCG2577492.1 diguanylate cyclase [Dechloromonas hankyongensis]
MKNISVPVPAHLNPFFLSTLTASRGERRLAFGAMLLSLLAFVVMAPFAKEQLPAISAFIPIYQSALVVIDLITVILLLNQYISFNSRALFVLGCGYLFSASMTVVHTLTFPGLFAPGGLLGAGPQSTAWLYMLWHGGFPLFIIGYALIKRLDGDMSSLQTNGRQGRALVLACFCVLSVVTGLALLATAGQDLLPTIMQGNRYTPSMIFVISTVWLFGLGALLALWLSRPHSVLDLWLMVVMTAWLIDVALSAMLNQGRFDLGFYAGRIYGLLAASFVLLVLLAESGMLYKQLVQLTATLQRLTTQDALTGIANRRAFDGGLDAEWRRAQRSGLPLSLMMIDVDFFKGYNDRYGHIAGDKCLQAVAGALRLGMPRATDLVARYGGEEFVVLLAQTEATMAAGLAERLRQAIEALALPSAASPFGFVSVSIGVAGVHLKHAGEARDSGAEEGGPARLVEAADRQLYAAKEAGRNRVEYTRP